jgi:hypothetical protein
MAKVVSYNSQRKGTAMQRMIRSFWKDNSMPSYFLAGCLLLVAIAGCASSSSPATQSEPDDPPRSSARAFQPIHPQPLAGDLAPGLSVTYFRNFKARHLDALPRGEYARDVGRPGEPVAFLNHAFGKGVVFGSGEKRLIGMRMQGLIRFPQSGSIGLKAFVNDGIRLYIDGRLVLDEAKWKSEGDRFTAMAHIDAIRGQWYPLTIEYFQRKGTATLKVLWQLPHSETFEAIPADAYAHLADK